MPCNRGIPKSPYICSNQDVFFFTQVFFLKRRPSVHNLDVCSNSITRLYLFYLAACTPVVRWLQAVRGRHKLPKTVGNSESVVLHLPQEGRMHFGYECIPRIPCGCMMPYKVSWRCCDGTLSLLTVERGSCKRLRFALNMLSSE